MNRFTIQSLVIATIGALAFGACGENSEITAGQAQTPPETDQDAPTTALLPPVTGQAPPVNATTSPTRPSPPATVPGTAPPTGPPATIPAGGLDIWSQLPTDQQGILHRTQVPVLLPTIVPGTDEATRFTVASYGSIPDIFYSVTNTSSTGIAFDAVKIVEGSVWIDMLKQWELQAPVLQGKVRGYQADDGLLLECEGGSDDYVNTLEGAEGSFVSQGFLWWADLTEPGYVYQIAVSPVPGCSGGRYTVDDLVQMADSVVKPAALD